MRPIMKSSRVHHADALKPGRVYVADDLGELWYFDPNTSRIKLHGDDSMPVSERGYHCTSLENGIEVLRENGYITVKR